MDVESIEVLKWYQKDHIQFIDEEKSKVEVVFLNKKNTIMKKYFDKNQIMDT